MISLVVLGILLVVNVAAGIEYPPLLANALALIALMVVAWRELREQKQPGSRA